ncbi:MAG: S8 family serine peptidase [Acidimicrobiales bacterium]
MVCVVVSLAMLPAVGGAVGAEEPAGPGGPAVTAAGGLEAATAPSPSVDREPLGELEGPAVPGAHAGSVVVELGGAGLSGAQVAAAAGGDLADTVSGTDFVVIDVGDEDPESVAAGLRDQRGVISAEPNGVMRAAAPPNDPQYGAQRPVADQIRLEDAWRVETGDASVIVAVIDSGVDPDHPDLTGRLVPGRNVLTGTADTTDDNGHGTKVAGVIGARRDNGTGMSGVAGGGVRIMPVKVLDADGESTDAHVAEGIRWATDNGADIVNLSLGRLGTSNVVAHAVARAISNDVVVVASTGNDGVKAPSTPAGEPGVLGVAATDTAGQFASFSTYGYQVDITAPGMGVLATLDGGGYGLADGTSLSTALVSGVAALVRSRNPGYDESRIRLELIRATEDRGPVGVDDSYGFGLLDAGAALGMQGREPFLRPPPPVVDLEPNDVPARAQVAQTANVGSIDPEGDVDWWRVPVADARRISVELTPSTHDVGRAANFDPVIQVYGSDGNLLQQLDERGTGEAEALDFTATGGDVRIAVSNAHGATSAGTYTLAVTAGAPEASTAWQPPSSVTTGTGTKVYLQSTDHPIAGSRVLHYDQTNSTIASNVPSEANDGRLLVRIDGFESWDFGFQPPEGQTELATGTVLESPWFSGEGSACGPPTTGWVSVDDVVYDDIGLASYELRFEHSCRLDRGPLRGWMRWVRDDPAAPAGIMPDPGGLWSPRPDVIPSSGNVFRLESELDSIGRGETHQYDDSDASILASLRETGVLTVTVSGAEPEWTINLAPPAVEEALRPGYLPELEAFPVHNEVRGGLQVSSSEFHSCQDSFSWAVIDEMTVVEGALSSLVLRFEHRCERFGTPAHGFVRWSNGSGGAAVAAPPIDHHPIEAAAMPPTEPMGPLVTPQAQIPLHLANGPWLLDTHPTARTTVPTTELDRLTISFGRAIFEPLPEHVVLFDGLTGAVLPTTMETTTIGGARAVHLRPQFPLPPGMALVLGVGGVRDEGGRPMPATFIPFITAGRAFPTPELGWDFDPLVGDYNGDGIDDVLLYQPGADPDFTMYGSWEGFYIAETPVNGAYEPFTVDLNGDGYDDIIWYRPGPGQDYIWYGEPTGFRSVPTSAVGYYEPFSLDLNGDGYDDIIWYRPGHGQDYIWYGKPDGYTSVPTRASGVYRPFALDMNGDGFDDIVWYAPGAAVDYIWYGTTSGHTSVPTRITGTYEAIPGDFNGDGYDDITWYRAGTVQDYVWSGSATGFSSRPVTINGTYRPVGGDFNGDLFDDILFYGVGSLPESIVFGSRDGHL